MLRGVIGRRSSSRDLPLTCLLRSQIPLNSIMYQSNFISILPWPVQHVGRGGRFRETQHSREGSQPLPKTLFTMLQQNPRESAEFTGVSSNPHNANYWTSIDDQAIDLFQNYCPCCLGNEQNLQGSLTNVGAQSTDMMKDSSSGA